jgi:hypothetical protein
MAAECAFFDDGYVHLFDDDKWTLDNVFRVFAPIRYAAVGTPMEFKTDLGKWYLYEQYKVYSTVVFSPHFMMYQNTERVTEDTVMDFGEDTLFIGSPDLETRKMLHDVGSEFFFFGHHSNETEVFYRPMPEMDLGVETYGMVDIGEFWAGIYASFMDFLDLDHENYEFKDGESVCKFKASRLGELPF